MNSNSEYAGVPYNDIKWYDVTGQPFGIASNFNAIILGDADNIVDTKGAMAVGGNFTSQRGLSLGYGNNSNLIGTGYSPDLVRFLVGGNVATQGPLVVIGHVVAGGSFKAARGSTYMIGKNGSNDQIGQLTALYQANGGSKYWSVADRGTHYAISSFDVPRYIPASRIQADTSKFFADAAESLMRYHDCITQLQPNGTVTEHYHEWILRGNDPSQNVFLIDVSPNGTLDKEIRFEIPQGSRAVVILRTGNEAHLRYGLWGAPNLAQNTLYVFEDAQNIRMEVPAAIWGSILAPQATYYAHPTGGTVSGNAALGSLKVVPTSGFEFHLFPFTGGVMCNTTAPMPAPVQEAPEESPVPETQEPVPNPPAEEVPEITPTPAPCPEPQPCPPQRSCPEPQPCPPQQPCPNCPPCPKPTVKIQPVPIPVPMPCPECEECLIQPGVIFGCVWGCQCGHNHEWEVRLYRKCGEERILLHCKKICNCGCFEFRVQYDDFYILMICPVVRSSRRRCCKGSRSCRPLVTLKNVGVANLIVE